MQIKTLQQQNPVFFSDAKKKILIVDDEPVNIFVLKKMLSKDEFEIDSYPNAKKAIDAVMVNEYDAVLMDLMMPDMSGFEACTRICEMKPYLPIIVLTAMIDDQSIEKSFKSGAVDYIKKPLEEVDLFSRLNNAIRLKKSEERYVKMYTEMIEDLNMASEIQTGLLPPWIFCDGNMIASSLYEPSHKIGGDLFDIIPISDSSYVVYMGDISGHGVQAALLMTSVRSFVHMLIATQNPDILQPHRFLTELNSLVTQRLFSTHYLTFIFMFVDTKKGQVCMANAGHPPPFLYQKKKNKVQLLDKAGGVPLGWISGQTYKKEDEQVVDFDVDSSLLLYTDGIFECADNGGEQLGLDRLTELFEKSQDEKSRYIVPFCLKEKLLKRNYDFGGDDFTLLHLQNHNQKNEEDRKVFHLRSILVDVGKVCKACDEQVLKWGCGKEIAFKVEIVLGEYLNNIIVHGLKEKGNIPIFVEMCYVREKNYISLRFFDKGMKWDLQQKKEKFKEKKKEKMRTSKYGIGIVEDLSKNFQVRRICDVNETIVHIETVAPAC